MFNKNIPETTKSFDGQQVVFGDHMFSVKYYIEYNTFAASNKSRGELC